MLRRKLLLLDEQDGLFVAMSTIIVTTGWHAPMFELVSTSQSFVIASSYQSFLISNQSQSLSIEGN